MRKLANGTNQAKRFLRSPREDIDFFGFSDIGKKKKRIYLMVAQAEGINQPEEIFLLATG
jgi:hypothetical protein